MDISIEELYMLLGAKDVQIYKLQQEIKSLKNLLAEIGTTSSEK